MNFEVVNKIEKQDEQVIYDELLKFNTARLTVKPMDLGVYLRDESGQIVGGLIGLTFGKWLHVKYLCVREALKKKAIGSQILQQAENEAKKRGCQYAFLDTFDFQAPEFYKKYGYKEVFVLENYPQTGKRFYLVKEL